MKILVVEDEIKLNQNLVEGLRNRGYAVDFALTGTEGEELAVTGGYDVIVLDLMLPERNGLEVCRNLRVQGINTPIIFLTARDAVEDKILGLQLGADDYLVKPFSFDELVVRIRTLLRRTPQMISDVLTLDELELDTQAQKVQVGKKIIVLTGREYGLLEYLLRNKGRVVTREDLLSHVWDRFHDSLSNVVDVHLKNLRKKLPKAYAQRVQTIWGKGYRLT